MSHLKLVVDNTNLIEAEVDPKEMEQLRAGFDDWMDQQTAELGKLNEDLTEITARAEAGKSIQRQLDDLREWSERQRQQNDARMARKYLKDYGLNVEE